MWACLKSPIMAGRVTCSSRYLSASCYSCVWHSHAASTQCPKSFHSRSSESVSSLVKQVDPRFESVANAHKDKSTYELSRALTVFRLLSIESLVKHNQKLMKIGRTVLGRSLFQRLMDHTFYGHFVAGSDEAAVKPVIENNLRQGVNTMLYWAAEEDKGETAGSSLEEKYVRNADKFKLSVEAVAEATTGRGFIAVKPTALCPPNILLKLNKIMDDHSDARYYSLTDLTQICDAGSITSEEVKQAENMIERVASVIQYAADHNTGVMMDAEQTYFQSAINNLLGVQMMETFNKERVVLCNTYQCYLKITHERVQRDMQYAREKGFKFGARLVRGAYLTQEREVAEEAGVEDPTNPSFRATTEQYHKVAESLFDAMNQSSSEDVQVMFATHNEETLGHILHLLDKHNPPLSSFAFGQLHGMCDHVSFHLGQAGFPVYKSMPYGPIDLVLSYLGRRAIENRGVLDKIKKEGLLLSAELNKRRSS